MMKEQVGQQTGRAEPRGLIAWLRKPRGFDLNPSTMYLIGLGLYLAVQLAASTSVFRSGGPMAFDTRSALTITSWLSVLFMSGNIVSRPYKQGEIVASILALVVSIAVWFFSGYRAIFFLTVMVIGAKDVPFDSIVKLFLVLMATIILVGVIATILGLVPERFSFRPDGTVRHTFGALHPNRFGARVFFWSCGWFYLRRDRHNFLDFLLVLGLAAFTLLFTDSRTSSGCMFFLAGIILVLAIRRIVTKRELRYGRFLQTLLVALVILCVLFSLSVHIFYDPDVPWFAQLNGWMTGRLSLGKNALLMYPPVPFGQRVLANIDGSEGVLVVVDNAYLYALLYYGIVFFLEIVALLIFVNFRLFRLREYTLPLVIVLVAIFAISERLFLNMQFDIFLLAGMAALPKKSSRISTTPRASEAGRTPLPGESGRLGGSGRPMLGLVTPTPRVSRVERDFTTPGVSPVESDVARPPVVPLAGAAAIPSGGRGGSRRSNTPRVSDSRALPQQQLDGMGSSDAPDVFDAPENPHTAWRVHLTQGHDDA